MTDTKIKIATEWPINPNIAELDLSDCSSDESQEKARKLDSATSTAIAEPSWWHPAVSRLSEIPREVIILFYTTRLFVPGFFQRRVMLFTFGILPLIDFVTDYYTAGTVSKIKLLIKFDRFNQFCEDHFKTVKGGALTGTNVSLPSRSIRWAMLINLIVSPSISERVRPLAE